MNELTALEFQIVKLLYNGYTRAETIAETTLTNKGVADNIRSIKYKLQVASINGIKSAYCTHLDLEKVDEKKN